MEALAAEANVSSTSLTSEMAERLRLDFSRLPTFDRSPLFFTLPDDVADRLRRLPRTFERAQCALRFSSKIGAGKESMGVSEPEVLPMASAYLRAALMDFVGMEEVLKADLRSERLPGPHVTIEQDANAHLVVLREMRNAHLHVSHAAIRREMRAARIPRGNDWFEFEVEAELVDEADLDRLLDSRKSRRIDRTDFVRAIEWLKDAQSHWGIADVLIRGIWEWSRVVADRHSPAAS